MRLRIAQILSVIMLVVVGFFFWAVPEFPGYPDAEVVDRTKAKVDKRPDFAGLWSLTSDLYAGTVLIRPTPHGYVVQYTTSETTAETFSESYAWGPGLPDGERLAVGWATADQKGVTIYTPAGTNAQGQRLLRGRAIFIPGAKVWHETLTRLGDAPLKKE